MRICDRCNANEDLILGMCCRCHDYIMKTYNEDEVKHCEEQDVGMLPFIEAKLLFNVIRDENDKLDDSDVIGVALYKHKETGLGRVIFKGMQIDEDIWQQVMINAAFVMDDNETTLKVKIATTEDTQFVAWLNSK